ncbi:unnamed protein product [Clonostachys rosea]|uniref:Uncharacterized protein n=1 Tax=Bionectria ochroleuca TaxID=29856 RepID=A0ABY6TZV1_BIOOC|nr:unnamed protein product [Clonostachys rosea]
MKVSTVFTSSLFLLASGAFAYQDLATRGEDLVAKGEYLIARGEYLIARANTPKKAAPAKAKGNKSGHLGGAEAGTCEVQKGGPGFCKLNTGHRVACEGHAKCLPSKKGCGWVPGRQRADCGLEAGRLGH